MGTFLDLTYPSILVYMNKYLASGRTESRAFLAWFLENFYRLDEIDAYDAICDGPDDKGIDGIFVDDNLEQIVIFQSKLLQNANRALGDSQLKTFVGALEQFSTAHNVQRVSKSTGNQELRNLIQSTDIAEKIKGGYSTRGVFVTNVNQDVSAKQYLQTVSNIEVFDAKRLSSSYVPAGPSSPQSKSVTFDLYGQDIIEHQVGNTSAIFAPVSATDLLRLDGLDSGELFVWNVRRSLGKTKVNKEIASSIKDASEHRNFLLYHNGITILTQELSRSDDKITITNYTVVNGAQSLTSLYENRSHVSGDLRILARIIRIPPESELANKITHHSNNQNSINARDLQSNSALQRRLQNEFSRVFPGKVFYRIQRGEETNYPIMIDNEDAARIMLAFDLQQPWTCHQSYKLFDDLHRDIFARPEVNAHRIYTERVIYDAVLGSLHGIDNELLGKYRLTRYFMLFVLRQVLDQDELGQKLVRDPEPFVATEDDEAKLARCIQTIMDDLIIDLNAELKEREELDEAFDYKREFKSPNPVRQLATNIISPYQKAVARSRATSFSEEWLSTT